jgi:hypothetical protein
VAVKLAVSLEQVMVFGYERRVANPFPVLVFFCMRRPRLRMIFAESIFDLGRDDLPLSSAIL